MFESQPGLHRIKVYSALHPPGSLNEYQLWLGRQRQVYVSFHLRMKRRVCRLNCVILDNTCYTRAP